MTSALLLGALAGLRHTFDADHLAAVASLGRSGGWLAALYRGAAWGLGHSAALLAFGGLSLHLGGAPAGWSGVFEGAVGVLLLALGGDVVLRVVRRRAHVHPHEHADGVVHAHPHAHRPHEATVHDHPHRLPVRALCVGALHGLAGSGALVVLVLGSTSSVGAGLAWMAVFGLGSIAGMAVMSVLLTAPVTLAAPRFTRVAAALEIAVGLATVAVGVQLLVERAGS